jgi:hypothetical protein
MRGYSQSAHPRLVSSVHVDGRGCGGAGGGQTVGAPLAPGSLAWIVLAWGQQGAAWMAGGMLALEVVAGCGQTRRVRVCMRLAAVQAAQAVHETRGPFPHCGVALRAVPGKE